MKDSLANEQCVADLARAKKVILKLKSTNVSLNTECSVNYQDVETLKAQLRSKVDEHAVLESESPLLMNCCNNSFMTHPNL